MAVFINPPALFTNYDATNKKNHVDDPPRAACGNDLAEPTWMSTQPQHKTTSQTSRSAPFRLLDLPPELRIHIYRELLALPVATCDLGCYPQILATSKQINNEATGLLYGENFIHIRILPDGVFIRHTRCGSYVPAPRDTHKPSQRHLRSLIWPACVRKARFVSVDALGDTREWREAFTRPRPKRIHRSVHEICVSNVLWSLGIELEDDVHRLMLVQYLIRGRSVSSPAYAMRMFRGARCLGRVQPLADGDPKAKRMASEVRAGSWTIDITVMWTCLSVLWRAFHSCSRFCPLFFSGFVVIILMKCLLSWLDDADRFTTGRFMTLFLRSFVFEFRLWLNCVDIRCLPRDVLKRVNEVLHLEVEVELATRENRRHNIRMLPNGNLQRVWRRLRADGRIPTVVGGEFRWA